MQPTPNSQELVQIMRFVQSPAGQQLLASLQQLNSNEINSAMADAAAGNYDRAQKTISAFLATRRRKSCCPKWKAANKARWRKSWGRS